MHPKRAADEVGPGAETNSRNGGLNLVDVTLGLKIRTLRPGFEYGVWKVNLKPTRLVHATRCQRTPYCSCNTACTFTITHCDDKRRARVWRNCPKRAMRQHRQPKTNRTFDFRCQMRGAILSVLTEFERRKMHASKSTKQLTGRETEFAKDFRSVTLAQFLGRQDLFELTTNRIDSRGKDLNFTR